MIKRLINKILTGPAEHYTEDFNYSSLEIWVTLISLTGCVLIVIFVLTDINAPKLIHEVNRI